MSKKLLCFGLRLVLFVALVAVYYVGKIYLLDGMYLSFWAGQLSWSATLLFWPLWILFVLPTALVSILLQGLAAWATDWQGLAVGWYRYFVFFASPFIAATAVYVILLDLWRMACARKPSIA